MFKTTSKDENDTLYFETIVPISGIFTTSSVRVEHSLTIPPGNYTELAFSQVLDQQLRNIPNIFMGSAYDSANNMCSISTWSSDIQFRILTDAEIMGNGSINSPHSINLIFE